MEVSTAIDKVKHDSKSVTETSENVFSAAADLSDHGVTLKEKVSLLLTSLRAA